MWLSSFTASLCYVPSCMGGWKRSTIWFRIRIRSECGAHVGTFLCKEVGLERLTWDDLEKSSIGVSFSSAVQRGKDIGHGDPY